MTSSDASKQYSSRWARMFNRTAPVSDSQILDESQFIPIHLQRQRKLRADLSELPTVIERYEKLRADKKTQINEQAKKVRDLRAEISTFIGPIKGAREELELSHILKPIAVEAGREIKRIELALEIAEHELQRTQNTLLYDASSTSVARLEREANLMNISRKFGDQHKKMNATRTSELTLEERHVKRERIRGRVKELESERLRDSITLAKLDSVIIDGLHIDARTIASVYPKYERVSEVATPEAIKTLQSNNLALFTDIRDLREKLEIAKGLVEQFKKTKIERDRIALMDSVKDALDVSLKIEKGHLARLRTCYSDLSDAQNTYKEMKQIIESNLAQTRRELSEFRESNQRESRYTITSAKSLGDFFKREDSEVEEPASIPAPISAPTPVSKPADKNINPSPKRTIPKKTDHLEPHREHYGVLMDHMEYHSAWRRRGIDHMDRRIVERGKAEKGMDLSLRFDMTLDELMMRIQYANHEYAILSKSYLAKSLDPNDKTLNDQGRALAAEMLMRNYIISDKDTVDSFLDRNLMPVETWSALNDFISWKPVNQIKDIDAHIRFYISLKANDGMEKPPLPPPPPYIFGTSDADSPVIEDVVTGEQRPISSESELLRNPVSEGATA